MCNQGCSHRSWRTHFRMALRRIAGHAAILACIGFPLAAQVSPTRASGFYVDEFEPMYNGSQFNDTGTPTFANAFPVRRTEPPQQTPLVSVDELRHPLTGRARRFLATAFGYAERGDHTRAISTLHDGVAKEATLAPYAHGLLGIEYLRLGRSAEAIPELTEAVTLFPHDPLVHTNYAISLCIVGQFDNAERETKLALTLDPSLQSAQELIELIEVTKTARAHSARN